MSNVRRTTKWWRFMQLDGANKWLLLRAAGWLLIARMLLKRYGYASTIHFGVERAGEDVLNGHAWLTCGETVVTGGAELNRYAEIHHLGE